MSARPKDSSLRGNIPRLFLLEACSGGIFLIPIIVPFWQSNGLRLQEIFVLQGFYALSLFFLEIPSGYLADRWGRKRVLVTGSLFGFLGILAHATGASFWAFLLGELLLSVQASFYSGTIEATTYDTLVELGQEKTYRRVAGRQSFCRFGTESISSLLGGFLILLTLRAPVWATLVPFGIGLLVAISLEEPPRHKLVDERHVSAILRICRETFHNPALRSVIVLSSILSTFTMALFWLTQPYQDMIGLPLALYGVTHALIVGAGALAGTTVHRLERWADDRVVLIIIGAILLLCCIALGWIHAWWGLLAFVLVRITWSIHSTMTIDLVNRMTTPDFRATVLSLRAFGFRLLFAISAPLVGGLADVSLPRTFLIVGGVAGVLLTMTFLMMRKVWREIPA
ncbi:MAG: major facilitator superfamily permease [Candidatus Peregrinibacteria bacterium Greene0416_19]|nr:MAG: major facilitator superfamily permease [Candidatus Peregrinibacteria bacterium Greene0416_19]